MLARRYVLKGRVQGVGFRYFVHQAAHDLGIRGWVRNLEDGTVEVHAQGGSEIMTRFVAEIRSGPSFAMVEDIQEDDAQTEDYENFFIER